MKLSLLSKVFGFIVLTSLLCLGVTITVSTYKAKHNGMRFLEHQSESLIGNYDAARTFIATQGLMQNEVERLVQKHPDGILPKEEKAKLLRLVPIYAALEISRADKNENYKVTVVAENARNSRSEASEQEKVFLRQFEQDPSLTYLTYLDESSNNYWYMKPIRLSKAQGCLTCHGHPSTSPWGNGKDILGHQMEDWKDGQIHGMYKVASSLNMIAAQTLETRNTVLLYGLLSALVVVVIVFFILRIPLGRITSFAQELITTAKRNKELGGRLKSHSQVIADGAQEQSSALAQTVSSTTEIRAMVERNTEASREMVDIARETTSSSLKGLSEINQLVQAFDEIRQSGSEMGEQMLSNAKQIDEIGVLIRKIEEKTMLINDIVFQTKLLAFNASVEAARAGEAGKGFAVVAEEVGALAAKSGASAKEIGEILDTSTERVHQIVEMMKSRTNKVSRDNEDRISKGNKIVARCQDNFSEINQKIELLGRRTQEILNASEEQNLGLGEIKEAVDALERVSHEFNEIVRQGQQAADELEHEASSLTQEAEVLDKLVSGY